MKTRNWVWTMIAGLVLATDAPAAPRLVAPQEVRLYEKAAVHGVVDAQVDNPDDPRQIACDLLVTAPDGAEAAIPAFWFQDHRVDDEAETVVPHGEPRWTARWLPQQAGTHTLTWRVVHAGNEERSARVDVEVQEREIRHPGFVRINPENRRYLLRDRSREWFPVMGGNVFVRTLPTSRKTIDRHLAANPLSREGSSPEGLYWTLQEHLRRIDEAAAMGSTVVRIRLDSWWLALENDGWFRDFAVKGFETGRYHPGHAWIADRMIAHAAKHGMVTMICTWNNNSKMGKHFGRGVYAADRKNENRAQMLIRRRLRYHVARWSWSPDVFGFEFFNEAGNQWNGTKHVHRNNPFFQKQIAWLREMDPNKHLILNSSSGFDLDDEHFYQNGQTPIDHMANWPHHDRPEMHGEFGLFPNPLARANKDLIAAHLLEGLAVSFANNKAGALNWRHKDIAAHDREHGTDTLTGLLAPIHEWLKGMPMAESKWTSAELATSGPGPLRATGMVAPTGHALVSAVRARAHPDDRNVGPTQGHALTVNGLSAGRLRYRVWDASAPGIQVDETVVVGGDGAAMLALPDGIRHCLLLRLEPVKAAP